MSLCARLAACGRAENARYNRVMADRVSAHYAKLLARHYSWMFGLTFEEKVTEQRTILEPVLSGGARGLAIDLGCGPGFQTIALAQLGFAPVLALDTSAELLAELDAHGTEYRMEATRIEARQADILTLCDQVQPDEASAIVCMGDTLTHLPGRDAVRRLFEAAATALAPDGIFVLTWRDLTRELTGAERFIPVRSGEDRIMTCFLEYVNAETVEVHDLVYTRDAATSAWALEKSSYPKLRLAAAWVEAELANAGLRVHTSSSAGRLSLAVAQKPA